MYSFLFRNKYEDDNKTSVLNHFAFICMNVKQFLIGYVFGREANENRWLLNTLGLV